MGGAASSRFRVLRRSSRVARTANPHLRPERMKALPLGENGLRGRFILRAAGVKLGGGYPSVGNSAARAADAPQYAPAAAFRSSFAARVPSDRSSSVNKSACVGPLYCDRLSSRL